MKKAVSLLLIVCLAITLLAGCSGNASQPSSEPPAAQETAAPQTDASQGESEPAAKKTMVIGDTTFNSENWEETVDPHRTYNGWACIRYGIGETLVHYTDSMELEPWLAKSWENDGNLTWTITLQDNVTFSSGRKMDAEAVKQCFEHLLENHDRAPGDTKIADMQADGQILTITTSEPNPALMNYLGDPYGCIIDVDASDFDAGIVAGTGPYVVTDMVTDDHLTLTKNENYWNSTPKIDELTIRTLGLMHTSQEFNDLVVREDADRIIRLSDVGRAELGPQDTRSYMKMNGIPMVGIVVVPQPGANHIEIADEVYRRMESMKKDLPEDVVTDYGFDNTRFIRASIDEVKQTVYEAFLLVIIIIFLFLRNWRVTLIPCIVIPVSLIGTFFLMYVAGFSINVLSMLAVVLSVGLVVDDAIVMTENIYIRIERGMSPKEAGIEGAKEIFFAVISTSITLIAVFFPIVFMEGMTGRLFREFSLVISGAVVISTFAALTITPMLATKLLVRQEKKSWLYSRTEPSSSAQRTFTAARWRRSCAAAGSPCRSWR